MSLFFCKKRVHFWLFIILGRMFVDSCDAKEFQDCVALHTNGNLVEAESCYQELLQSFTAGGQATTRNYSITLYNLAQTLDANGQSGKALAALFAMREIEPLASPEITDGMSHLASKIGSENPFRKLEFSRFSLYASLRNWLSASEAGFLTSVFATVAGLLMIVYLVSQSKKLAVPYQKTFLFFSIFFYIVTGIVKWNNNVVRKAVLGWGAVAMKSADVYSGPNPVVFSLVTQLSEGTAVRRVEISDHEKREGWVLVADSVKALGWVKQNEVAFYK